MELWQNFHQAKEILGEDFEHSKGEGREVHKTNSEKGIRYRQTQLLDEDIKISEEKDIEPVTPLNTKEA